jgi:hypothetical protein
MSRIERHRVDGHYIYHNDTTTIKVKSVEEGGMRGKAWHKNRLNMIYYSVIVCF